MINSSISSRQKINVGLIIYLKKLDVLANLHNIPTLWCINVSINGQIFVAYHDSQTINIVLTKNYE